MASGTLEAVLRGHSARVTSMAYRPDGKQIATYSDDQSVRLWHPSTGRQQALLSALFIPSCPLIHAVGSVTSQPPLPLTTIPPP